VHEYFEMEKNGKERKIYVIVSIDGGRTWKSLCIYLKK